MPHIYKDMKLNSVKKRGRILKLHKWRKERTKHAGCWWQREASLDKSDKLLAPDNLKENELSDQPIY